MDYTLTALLLIDIQNDYFPGGRNELANPIEAGRQAVRLLSQFRLDKKPVFHIQHISMSPGSTFFLPGTAGAEFHPMVKPLNGEPVVIKHYPNGFRETPLLDHLQELRIKRLIIAGMMSHMCVDATTRAACDFGFECTLVHNACTTRDLVFQGQTIPAAQVHGAFMAALTTYAKVSSVDEILSN